MMELCGDIPGLLRRCSPLIDPSDGERSVVVSVVEGIGVRCSVERDCRVESYNYTFRSLCLDLSDPTGRFHARLWLLERGHDVGNEDRAEVLAWSVLSVWRGGKPLLGVVGAWGPYGVYADGTRCYRGTAPTGGYACVTTGDFAEWWAGTAWRHLRGPETMDAGKAAADAALLALGWAITNADGSLTFPMLPGAS